MSTKHLIRIRFPFYLRDALESQNDLSKSDIVRSALQFLLVGKDTSSLEFSTRAIGVDYSFQVNIDHKLYSLLDDFATVRGISQNAIVVKAVRLWLLSRVDSHGAENVCRLVWEYQIIRDWDGCNPDSEFELNDLGKDGWELICVDQVPQYSTGPNPKLLGTGRSWYFRRKVKIFTTS